MLKNFDLYNFIHSQVLQKLGKADETKDEQFEQVVINFRRQEVRDNTFHFLETNAVTERRKRDKIKALIEPEEVYNEKNEFFF